MITWVESEWRVSEHCVNCNERLTSDQIYCNNGVCPLCGVKDKKAYNIVETYDRIYKVRYKTTRWWEFWKTEEHYRIYKDMVPKEDINSPEYDPLGVNQP